MKNPRYINEFGGVFIERDGEPDLYLESGDLYNKVISGAYGDVKPYEGPTEEELQAIADRERIDELKKLLADSDYKAMPDYDKTDSSILEQRQAWRDEIRTLEVK